MNIPLHEPTGDSKTDQWGRALVRWVKSQTLLSVTGGFKQQRPNGYDLILNPGGGGGTSGGPIRATLSEVLGDHLVCLLYGTSTAVKVAKTPWLRSSVTTETIWGFVVTYSNSAYTAPDKYQRRDATPTAGVTEKQVIYPYYAIGQEIWITPITPFDTADAPSVSATYIESHSRVWLRKLDQSS